MWPARAWSGTPWTPCSASAFDLLRHAAAAETVTVDGTEVLEARWFTRAELIEHAGPGGRLSREDSIDRYLLESWLTEPADAERASRPP